MGIENMNMFRQDSQAVLFILKSFGHPLPSPSTILPDHPSTTEVELYRILSCLRSGVDHSRFIGNDSAEELLTPLLRQLNFWCESGISHFLRAVFLPA